MRAESRRNSELKFFTNYIVRNVMPCTTIGNIHDGSEGVRSWAEKSAFKTVFDFSTEQLSQIDLSDLTRPEAVVAHNPFSECRQPHDLALVVDVLSLAERCVIAAIPTKEHYQVRPHIVGTIKSWRDNLSKLGTTVEFYHCDEYSLFLTLK